MMTQAKKQTLMMAVTVALGVTCAKDQLWRRLNDAERERGALSLEWAIIAAIVVALAAIVAVAITAAVKSHVADIH
jgi:hypothetical protein